MKYFKFYQWLTLMLVAGIFATGCSKKNYATKVESNEDEEATYVNRDMNNRPQEVIYISDEKSKTNRNGEIYYDDENGFRYWKYCDGKYYLDSKYEQNGYTPEKKTKKNKKKPGKSKQPAEEEA